MELPFLPQSLWAEIRPVFQATYPCEAVVAIWEDGWRQLRNVARDPLFEFSLTDADRVALLVKKPLILLHSHPNGKPIPSDLDTINQIGMNMPWGIVAVSGVPETCVVHSIAYPESWGAGLPIPPLLSRPYLWGIRDCVTLCADFYALNGVHLPRVPRAAKPSIYPKGHWGNDQFLHEPARLGLKPVKRHQRKPGDMTRWQYQADRYNHCAIYLGEGRFLHQPRDAASTIHTTDNEEKFIERLSIEFFRPKSMKGKPICDISALEQVSPRPNTRS